MNEWVFQGAARRGDRGGRTRLAQEWLCLHGVAVVPDGDFGPATEAAVRTFQDANGLSASGVVNRATFDALVAPMVAAVAVPSPGKRSLGQLVVACARQHLTQSPREVGGQNMGPWVRLYMKGNEGAEWPWCAGFACYVLRQAARALDVNVPLPYTFSCDSLAAAGKSAGIFLDGRSGIDPARISPGSLFLSRRTALDWVHTGLVVRAEADSFVTIEGNTNDSGDREGYEVCSRMRGYPGKDFVVSAA